MSIHSDDSDNLLSESSYEILTDSTLLTDEDYDGTSSIASLGSGTGSEDEDEETGSVAGSPTLHAEPQILDEHPGIPTFGLDGEQQMEQSSATLRDAPEETIIFDESGDLRGDQVAVCRTINIFDETQTREVRRHLRLDDLPSANLIATIRQTMSKQPLSLEEPFRLLYVGSTAAKDDITHLVATALAAPAVESTSSSGSWEGIGSMRGSRFNVVPVSSFGSGTPPEVELVESLGVELTVDLCTAATATKREGRPDTLGLWLNQNHSISSSADKKGYRLDAVGWKVPHLAIVYVADDDNTRKKMTRTYARSFMARHSIPTIVVSQTTLYNRPAENFTLDRRSIHMCLESGDLIQKRLPIDLAHFRNLDPRQLNRNLACLTGLVRPIEEDLEATSKRTNSLPLDIEKFPQLPGGRLANSFYWFRNVRRENVWKIVLLCWLVVSGLAGATFAIAWAKFAKQPVTMQASISPVPQAITISSTVMSSSVVAAITSSTPILASTPHPSALQPQSTRMLPKFDISNYFQDPVEIPVSNASDKFQVHVLGKDNVIIRPPQKFLNLRRPLQLAVKVTRGESEVVSKLSQPLEGVYTLQISEDEAWGQLKVSIATKGRPNIREAFDIDLGMPWTMKLNGWSTLAGQKKDQLQNLLEQATDGARSKAGDLSKIAGTRAVGLMDVVKAKTQDLAKIYEDTKAVSARYSDEGKVYVKKASSQAKKIWEKRKNDA